MVLGILLASLVSFLVSAGLSGLPRSRTHHAGEHPPPWALIGALVGLFA